MLVFICKNELYLGWVKNLCAVTLGHTVKEGVGLGKQEAIRM